MIKSLIKTCCCCLRSAAHTKSVEFDDDVVIEPETPQTVELALDTIDDDQDHIEDEPRTLLLPPPCIIITDTTSTSIMRRAPRKACVDMKTLIESIAEKSKSSEL